MAVRRAGVDDADALVRLRAIMFDAMGTDPGDEHAGWRRAAREWFRERLAVPAEFAAFVVDDPELGVVSSAVGACDRHGPGPANPSGLHGHISDVCTDQRRLRRGYARLCVRALLDWFATETDVRVIDLHSTGDGDALYRALGFAEPRFPALRLTLPRHAGRPDRAASGG